MAKKDNNNLLYIGLGAAALYVFSQQNNSNHDNCTKYRISPTQSVCEHELPNYGYIQYQGQWAHYTTVNQMTGQNNSQSNWQDILNGVVAAAPQVIEIVENFFNNNNNNGGSGGNTDNGDCIPSLGIFEGC